MENNITPIEKDLTSRKEEIKEEFEDFFAGHIKKTNWNVPEAPDQQIAEGLLEILVDKLNEISQKVKAGEYEEKRNDIFQ